MNSVNFSGLPVIPNKVVCVGFNYKEHIEEIINKKEIAMAVFLKTNSSISSRFYHFDKGYEYEGELSFIFANKKPVGVAFGIDITNRKLQYELMENSLPWSLAKSFNNAAVFSRFVTLDNINIKTLHMEFYRNSKLIQKGGYEHMINKPKDIVEQVSKHISFNDGDILMTGTPRGTTAYEVDDVFEGRIYSDDKLIIKKVWQVKPTKP